MVGCKPALTLIKHEIKIENGKDNLPIDHGQFQRLVGWLIYLSHIGPNIAFAIGTLSHFLQNLWEVHKQLAHMYFNT